MCGRILYQEEVKSTELKCHSYFPGLDYFPGPDRVPCPVPLARPGPLPWADVCTLEQGDGSVNIKCCAHTDEEIKFFTLSQYEEFGLYMLY